MAGRFDRKVAIVTGGVSGIGAAITQRLAEEGAFVVAADINAELTATATATFGENVMGRTTDVTNEDDFKALVAEAVESFGTLDMMFNVAGGARAGSLTETSLKDWDFTIRLNLHSVFLGIQQAARQFISEKKSGAIVNIASLNSIVPMHTGGGYATSKAGAVMLTRQAALELAEFGIRVNALSPGLIATPMAKAMLDIPAARDAYLERIPFKRVGEPSEIAAAALFLASDDASYISGDNLVVDGAWSTSGFPDLRPFL
jgi:meso-butanediol dehydrogenase / (S,S)-butanediol dehydrogenase / diacetyl reductase